MEEAKFYIICIHYALHSQALICVWSRETYIFSCV